MADTRDSHSQSWRIQGLYYYWCLLVGAITLSFISPYVIANCPNGSWIHFSVPEGPLNWTITDICCYTQHNTSVSCSERCHYYNIISIIIIIVFVSIHLFLYPTAQALCVSQDSIHSRKTYHYWGHHWCS